MLSWAQMIKPDKVQINNLEEGIKHIDCDENIARYPNSNIIYNNCLNYKFRHPTYIEHKDISSLILGENNEEIFKMSLPIFIIISIIKTLKNRYSRIHIMINL